jgi:hypothetical protein
MTSYKTRCSYFDMYMYKMYICIFINSCIQFLLNISEDIVSFLELDMKTLPHVKVFFLRLHFKAGIC